MTRQSITPVKLLLMSAMATLIVLMVCCYIWTDFKLNEIANTMFWVGGLVMIVGGSNFFPSSKYQGQSEASMFSLRYKHGVNHPNQIIKKENELTKRMIRGALIALPGLLLVAIALLILTGLEN